MNAKILLIAAAAAYFFRAKLETAFGMSTPTVDPVAAATAAAAAAAASGASPSQQAVAGQTAGTNAAATQTALNTTGTNTRTTASVTITPALQAKAATDPAAANLLAEDPAGFLSVDQWNFYYNQTTGKPGPNVGIPGEGPISAQSYQARKLAAGLGLSGVRRWR